MATRKRGRAELGDDEVPKNSTLLSRLRNMWEFANIMQFIMLFGSVFKIDENFEIEDLEDECMKPEPSHKLLEIGLCMLKFISSHRGLTTDLFDEYTRRQYVKRAPNNNPFGEEEEVKKFLDFDVFTKLKVLVTMSQWTFTNPDRIRSEMVRLKGDEELEWRVDQIGWDKYDRSYYVLDDNRLYRRTDPAIPAVPAQTQTKVKAKSKPKPKPKPKPKSQKPEPRKGTRASERARASKRMKTAEGEAVDVEPEEEEAHEEEPAEKADTEPSSEASDTFKWECVAVSLEEYQQFLEGIRKSKDINEKNLYKYITTNTLPALEKVEELRQKKVARRQKELENMERMVHAKRSSRLAGKIEKEQQEAESRAAEEKRRTDLAAARKDAERQKHMEQARESRIMTRERRVKEREFKRVLLEEETQRLREDSEHLENGDIRGSKRNREAEKAKKEQELKALEEEVEEDWYFDCSICGIHGHNVDDGSLIIACDECNVWQHNECLGIPVEESSRKDFQFVCQDCKRKAAEAKREEEEAVRRKEAEAKAKEQEILQMEEDAKKPKLPPLKFKLSPTATKVTKNDVLADKVEGASPTKTSHALQEQQNLDDGTSKKRKSVESDDVSGLPPTKKWKTYTPELAPASNTSSTANGVNKAQEGTANNNALFNGPTLTPHGQHPNTTTNGSKESRPAIAKGPPSPSRPVAHTNGARSNGLPPMGTFSSLMQSIPDNIASTETINKAPKAPVSSAPFSSSPDATKPFSSNGAHQTPISSQKSSFTTPGGSAGQSSPGQTPSYLNSPATNLPPSSAAAPVLQPGFSPQKGMPPSSPAPAPLSSPLHGQTSPMMAPPPSDPQAAGVSPLKQEPPVPMSSFTSSQSTIGQNDSQS